jgi:hypothetical protein
MMVFRVPMLKKASRTQTSPKSQDRTVKNVFLRQENIKFKY